MMQRLSAFMASPDWMTAQGMARRYADAEANGVEIGTPDNPFPGMSPEELAEMDEFKAGLIAERSDPYWRLREAQDLLKTGRVVTAVERVIEYLLAVHP